ncbi:MULTISPECIES: energy transducer TonB [unclassified Moraxella]|uniref:energy transducer TonB n=1 Tax=unclassified Moraxella TaxID=2685852 RepID=UPI003AF75576
MVHIKDSRSYHFKKIAHHDDRVLWFSTLTAVGLHALLIFGISFEDRASPTAAVQEVTTVLTENIQKNEKADFIANASQEGGGESDEKVRFENNTISPVESDSVNQTDDIVTQQQKTRQQAYQESYLRTTISWQEVNKENDNKKKKDTSDLEAQEQRLQQQIATLETKISTNQQLLAKKSAVQTISSNSTTTGEAAKYIENFRQQAYHIGNQQYPQEARAKGLKGDVRLLVIIDPTGKVKALQVLESSGSPILDEAAKNSVRKAAPFGAFTKDMKDILELRIIRTWRFGDSLTVDSAEN